MRLEHYKSGTPYHQDFAETGIPERFRVVLERVHAPCRVLEVGCHTGYFSSLLAQRGCSVVGMEQNAEAGEHARRHLDKLIIGDVEEPGVWDEIGKDFDLVLFLDVLEHLYDPWTVLRLAKETLAARGRVLASLPNVACWSIRRSLLTGRFVPPETGLDDPTHIRFFTFDSALNLFEDSGLSVVGWTTLWTSVPLDYRMAKLGPLGKMWRNWWVRRYPNLAVAVPLIEAMRDGTP